MLGLVVVVGWFVGVVGVVEGLCGIVWFGGVYGGLNLLWD